jgi:peptide-methionine (R)-S-oxide reductase
MAFGQAEPGRIECDKPVQSTLENLCRIHRAGHHDRPPLEAMMSDTTRSKIEKSREEWRRELNPEQFRITRQHGTERPFTGPYWDDHREGTYHCVCCDAPLYSSQAKFDSGTGWPSFTAPIDQNAVSEHSDTSMLMSRTEVRCAACDAHLGHVFPDGPPPTGLRYCMNGYALRLRSPDGTEA